MKKLATLFTGSYHEMRQIRTITIAAMFAAISIVLGYFTITIGDFLKIGFSSVSNEFVYYLFGPVVGGCFGGVLDIIKYLVNPTGPYFPGFTLNAILAGVFYGIMLYRKPLKPGRILLAKLVVIVICNILINTWCLYLLYGDGILINVPLRVIKNLIQWPIDSMIFYSVAKVLQSAGIFRAVKGMKNNGVIPNITK